MPRDTRPAVHHNQPEEGTMSTTPINPEPLLLNVDEAAHLLGLKPKTVYEYSAAGLIPSVKVGRLRRFSRAQLEAWVAAQTDLAT
jgi:excisionase family DNA binding protein